MRERLCYLALVLVPLIVYSSALLNEYGTPADFLHLETPGHARVVADHAGEGILNGALLDISFGMAERVSDLRSVRALGLLLLVFCGLALWQVLERAGWFEYDAAAVALGVVLLPTAQLAAGWATLWPGVLSALLALAGFAAAESELEQGGGRRFVAMLGGVLLYLSSAMCYFPGVAMALVPLTALALTRAPRVWPETRKWFARHAGLLLAGVLAAWLIERAMREGAGLTDGGSLAQRLIDLVALALPLALAPFLGASSLPTRILCTLLGIATVAGLAFIIRRRAATDVRLGQIWRLTLGGSVLIFAFVILMTPAWRFSYRSVWPLAGVVLVALLAGLRALGDRPGGRPLWQNGAMAGVVAVGAFIAFGQLHKGVVAPFATEWHGLANAALRANIAGDTTVQVLVPPEALKSGAMQNAAFDARVAGHADAALRAVAAAVHERFSAGLPKGVKLHFETRSADAPPAPGAVVFDLTKAAR
ncbi:MAG: hypothetical protein C0502_10280 [Opitutus sp.]|nr:hypothetical protein [Opitutus sp.]